MAVHTCALPPHFDPDLGRPRLILHWSTLAPLLHVANMEIAVAYKGWRRGMRHRPSHPQSTYHIRDQMLICFLEFAVGPTGTYRWASSCRLMWSAAERLNALRRLVYRLDTDGRTPRPSTRIHTDVAREIGMCLPYIWVHYGWNSWSTPFGFTKDFYGTSREALTPWIQAHRQFQDSCIDNKTLFRAATDDNYANGSETD